MRLSFEDKDSFVEAVESLRFNNPQNDSNSLQPTESSSDLPVGLGVREE